MNELVIRPVTRDDLAALAEIEVLSFSAPWSAQALELLVTAPNGGISAEENGTVRGYIGYLGVLDEWEITNVATHPDHRRRGIGRALVSALLQGAVKNDIRRVTLEVRASNAPAIALYESLGFTPCGLRKNFYANPREDGVIYEIVMK